MPCFTYLPDTELTPSQLKYLMLTQLVGVYLYIISMKQWDSSCERLNHMPVVCLYIWLWQAHCPDPDK
jgi:hypothetical protein